MNILGTCLSHSRRPRGAKGGRELLVARAGEISERYRTICSGDIRGHWPASQGLARCETPGRCQPHAPSSSSHSHGQSASQEAATGGAMCGERRVQGSRGPLACGPATPRAAAAGGRGRPGACRRRRGPVGSTAESFGSYLGHLSLARADIYVVRPPCACASQGPGGT